jgi:hypothetical protein
MKQCEKERAISCIRLAIELAGDGGITPFTDVEYNLMNQLLDDISGNTNNDSDNKIVVVNDAEEFFVDNTYDAYKVLKGKCFIIKGCMAIKVLDVPNDEYDNIDSYEFIYEKFDLVNDSDWEPEYYNWLQEQTEDKYKKYKITQYSNMNIASEDMFHLGKNGKLYTTVDCGDEYYEFAEITKEQFEEIRNEAITNESNW